MRMAAFVVAHPWWMLAALFVILVVALSKAADWLARRLERVEQEEEARLRRERVSRELADDIARRRREMGLDVSSRRQVRG